MNIKEIALRLAAEKYSQLPEEIMDWLDDIIAELAKGNEPVYAFRRKGLDDFCTCDENRFNELSQKPNLFEVRVFYALPPTASQIEQETAEAIAKMLDSMYVTERGAEAIRSGTWKEFK